MTLAFGLLGVIFHIKGQTLTGLEKTQGMQPSVKVEFNKNVEFLGYALHIGEPEDEPFEASNSHPLRQDLNEKRSQLKGEESLIKIFELGAELSYSFFVELFTRMDELPHEREYQIPNDILQNNRLNTPADLALMQEIMKQVNVFYQVSEFEQFWESSQSWYAKAKAEIDEIKPDENVIKTMEGFYEQKFLVYRIIPSLTFWSGPGFGFYEEGKKGNTAYFVLGPLSDDFRFNLDDRLKTLAIHEFGHSFVNHVLETTCSDLINDTESLFAPIVEKMRPQGYPEWQYCVNEHFVRAGEVLIPELMNDTTLSESNLMWNTEEKDFIYLPFIVHQLRSYRIEKDLSYKESIQKTMLDLKNKFKP